MTDAYCFTVNNYTEDDLQAIYRIGAPYIIIFGKEVGASGTPHLQGMIWREDEVRIRRDRMSKLLGGRAHLEVCKNLECSMAYCVKDFDVYCNICDDLSELARMCYAATKCREFIGVVIYNHLFGTDYTPSLLSICLHHHTHFCKFCRKH